MTDYNPKIDYLFCKYIYSSFEKCESELTVRNTYKELIEPTTDTLKCMMAFKKGINYIKTNCKSLSLNYISNLCIEMGLNNNFNENSINSMLTEYETTNSPKRVFLLNYILLNKPFNKYNQEFAFLFYNYERLINNIIPVIFYPRLTNEIVNLVNNNCYLNYLDSFILIYCDRCYSVNKKHTLYNRDDIVKMLLSKQTELVFAGVNSVSLYGSFSRDEATEYSDVDLFIKTSNENLSEDEISSIRKIVYEALKIGFDITFNEFNEEYSVEPLSNLYLVF